MSARVSLLELRKQRKRDKIVLALEYLFLELKPTGDDETKKLTGRRDERSETRESL